MTCHCGDEMGRENKEMTYDNKDCDDDCDPFDPVNRRIACRKSRAEILKQAKGQ